MGTRAVEQYPAEHSDWGLWAGVIGAPVVWAVQMQTGYSLGPWLCKSQAYYVIHIITILCVALTLGAAWLSYRQWKQTGGESPDETDGGAVARRRFLGALGVITSLMFTMLIVAQGLASFFYDACWT